MRMVFVVGIGPGAADDLTLAAAHAIENADVVFVVDKGEQARELVRARRAMCERHAVTKPLRIVEIEDPPRDRSPRDYEAAVRAWHAARAERYARALDEHLVDDARGAFLVWGDPSLYDSTLRILDDVARRVASPFAFEVIPGVTSVQALAARHRIALNTIGGSVLITTGRRLIEHGMPEHVDTVVVMLDGACAFTRVDEDVDIYWGANIGTEGEALVAGRLRGVRDEIVRLREETKRTRGWLMDTYLLRRRSSGETLDFPERGC